MVAARPLPASLQRIAKGFSTEAQAKIIDLHGKYGITDDGLEAFEMNDKVTEDGLGKLEAFLSREAVAKAPKVAAGGRDAVSTPAAKRRKPLRLGLGSISQSSSLGNLLGGTSLSQAISLPPSQASTSVTAEMDTVTPMFFAQESARTPEKVSKSLFQITLKTSLNSKLLVKRQAPVDGPKKWELLGDKELWHGKRNGAYEWMDETLEDRVAALDERLASVEDVMTTALCEVHPDTKVGRVGAQEQAEVVLCGRIVCEGLEGKLNERSILLEGSQASSKSARMRLNVAECKTFTAFPGQVVGVVGRSGMNGASFHARDYMAGLPIPASLPATPAVASGASAEAPLHMMVASGPYCLRDGLDYSPLERVLEFAVEKKPDALILFGPLLDASNQRVVAGDPVLPDDDDPRPFEDVYEFVLQKLAMGIRSLRNVAPKTQVFLVPALDEVMHFHPMPQPPYTASMIRDADQRGWLAALTNKPFHVQMLPNPAHIKLGGLKISLTSCDALTPLLREILLRPEGKKVEESLRQLLRQRTFFPVLPRDPPQVSEARAAALDFQDGVPDVCIFPSQCGGLTGTFVEETAFLNPGSVCKPAALGTFAEMWVVPRSEMSAPFNQRVRMDIHKLERSSSH